MNCPKCRRFLKKDGSCTKCSSEIPQTPKEEKRMSLFTVNHSEAGGGFDPIRPGKYEAIISKTEATTSNSGNPMIKVTLTIRSDVEQDYGKRKLFDNLVIMEKTMFKLQQVAKAVQIPEGTSVETPEQFAEAILYQPVLITTKNETYEGRVQDRVTFYDVANYGYDGSDNGGSRDPFADDGKPIDISDDDLPF